MPMLSITPTRQIRNTSTVLAENIDTTKFDAITPTLTAVATENPENLESTKKYLQLIGAADFDREFNDIVKQYETQFELQSLDIQRQANIQMQDTIMRSGEGVLGKLGSGAAADFVADTGVAITESAETAQAQLAEQYAKKISDVNDQYMQVMNELLGSTLTEYQENVDLFGMALLEEIAHQAGYEYETQSELEDMLQAGGFIEQIGDTTSYTVTAKGQQQITNILQSLGNEYGDYHERISRLVANMTESVMAKQYPSLDPESETYQSKAAALNEKFDEWLQEYATYMYYTDLGLATFDSGKLTVTPYQDTNVSDNSAAFVGDSINAAAFDRTTKSYIEFFGKYAGSKRDNSKQTNYITSILNDARDGNIPDGSFFVANYGSVIGARPLFYYENGKIYKTTYTENNLPGVIDPTKFYGLEQAGISGTIYGPINNAAAGRYVTGAKLLVFGIEYEVGADGLLYKVEANTGRFGMKVITAK